jgi:hypothetical protein
MLQKLQIKRDSNKSDHNLGYTTTAAATAALVTVQRKTVEQMTDATIYIMYVKIIKTI